MTEPRPLTRSQIAAAYAAVVAVGLALGGMFVLTGEGLVLVLSWIVGGQ